MAIEEIDIKIITETLTLTKGNMITGEIYFSTQNDVFPEKEWRDFVVVIMTWWYDALIRLIESKQNGIEEEFEFMDGPLLIKAVKVSEELLELNFIKEMRSAEQIFFTINISMTNFKSALLKSGKELLIDLDKKNWHSDDIDELTKRHHYLSNK